MNLALGMSALCLAAAAPVASAAEPLVDVTREVGIDFRHQNGRTGDFYMAENVGPGAVVLDFDGDGALDVLALQGGPLDGASDGSRLYRNRLGGVDGRFEDVTGSSGLRTRGYAMGGVVADFDADGDEDFLLLAYGANEYWRNQGDGTFREAAASVGLAHRGWSVSAAAADYDGDGALDLYVADYLDFALADNHVCRSASGARDYCAPGAYAPRGDRLYRNRGDGTFEDVTERLGLGAARGPGLGVLAGDFDDDGRLDFYVGNDGRANFLWLQQDDGFEDGALLAGLALNGDGGAEASMGIAGADFDGDGDQDLLLTHLSGETHTLYRRVGAGFWDDATVVSGLAAASRAATGFGLAVVDYDGDGDEDVFVANGAVRTLDELARRGDAYPLHQPNQLFRNRGEGRFEAVEGLAVLAVSEVSRGVARADLDNDGDHDLVVAQNGGPLRILRAELDGAWVGVRLVCERPGDCEGARVELEASDRRRVRWARRSEGYASANDGRALFRLPGGVTPKAIAVTWMDGRRETWPVDSIGRYLMLERGGGSSPATAPGE